MCSNSFAYAKERQNMNSVPNVSMANNNVNFGHKIKYSPEAKAEFARQMDKWIEFTTQPDIKINSKDFLMVRTIGNYFYNILQTAPRAIVNMIFK